LILLATKLQTFSETAKYFFLKIKKNKGLQVLQAFICRMMPVSITVFHAFSV